MTNARRSLCRPRCWSPITPRVTLGTEDAARFLSGLRRRGNWPDAAAVAVFGSEPEAFLGTAHITANELIPGRLLNPIEIQQTLLNQTEATP